MSIKQGGMAFSAIQSQLCPLPLHYLEDNGYEATAYDQRKYILDAIFEQKILVDERLTFEESNHPRKALLKLICSFIYL